jgi:hypothetical protein
VRSEGPFRTAGNKEETRPGQAYVVSTLENIAKVDKTIRADRRRSIREQAAKFDVGIRIVHTVVGNLGYRKVDPANAHNRKQQRKAISLEHVQHNHTEGDTFLRQIVEVCDT